MKRARKGVLAVLAAMILSTLFSACAADHYSVTFRANEDYMGSIVGAAEQTVLPGDRCEAVTAVPNPGYRFVEWSDGETAATIAPTPNRTRTLTARFEEERFDLPILRISTRDAQPVVSKEVYSDCTIDVANNGKDCFEGKKAQVRGHGNSTWWQDDRPKKSYRIKFDHKVDLFGMGAAKDWLLISNYADYSNVRNYLAYTLGGMLEDLRFTTGVQFAELYLNHTFLGVYLVCEKAEIGENRVDIADTLGRLDTGYLLEVDSRGSELSPDEFFWVYGIPLVIKDPDPLDPAFSKAHYDFLFSYIEKAYFALTSGDYAETERYIDVNTFADSYIIYELFHCVDVGYSSFYLYKDAGGKISSGPIWDFDLSAGNCEYSGFNTQELVVNGANYWYHLLLSMEPFRRLVAEKLARYRPMLETAIREETDRILAQPESFERNFDLWYMQTIVDEEGNEKKMLVRFPPNPSWLFALTTWRGHVEQVRDWLLESLAFLCGAYPL